VIDTNEALSELAQRQRIGEALASVRAHVVTSMPNHSTGPVYGRAGARVGRWTFGEAAAEEPRLYLPPFVVAVGPGAVLVADALDRSVLLTGMPYVGSPPDVEIFARDLVAAANRRVTPQEGGPQL
jgi:hypothetical protein